MSECRVSQKELIEQITDRIGLLVNTIPQWAKQKLAKINQQWIQALDEIEEFGDATPMTCLAMSKIMLASEDSAFRKLQGDYDRQTFNWYLGLRLIHDNMTFLIPPGGNEGSKDCCPFCPEDC